MSEPVLVAIISLLGTGFGTFGGILTTNKLVNHRLSELEKKVEKHNNIVERTYGLEGRMREAEHDIMEMKGK
ncbi:MULTISPECIES: hypothetical protein [Vagococcus]|uniref:hypothetical protein n=1 Tax=Vagococcus TaxID=2737 RepID=UPI000E4D7E5C|nr:MULTISPECIES: hypothetical protein [Vagococcus]RHH70091.1 hypothetical protein DW196_04820 [Vagococcus sp. AM17-17]